MDVFGGQWVAEFFLRRQINPRLTHTKLLSALKYGESHSPDNLNLKISSVLRDISNFLIRGTLDERMLDLLEMLEKLLLQQHSLILESHKSAYCWTAVECTLIFMWPLIASEGLNFTDALERIWKKRVGILTKRGSKLVTHDLLKWKTDLKKALEDPEVYQRIRETNVRYTSISFLNQLLKEQWALLGSSSLESVAQRMMLLNIEGDVVENSGHPNAVEDENGNNRENADNVTEVGCLENNRIDKVNEADKEHEMGAEEHEPSLNKDETAAQEPKDLLLKFQRHIDSSTSQGQQPSNALDHSDDVTTQPSQVNRTQKAKPHVRRLNKFWTPEEVEALREGVKEHGKSWKYIKNSNPAVFMERTEVDLKDKWRNLVGRY